MEWLGTNYTPFALVFTKADKLKPLARERNIDYYLAKMKEEMWEETPLYFTTSSLHKTGVEEILAYIEQLNTEFKKTR
jgi:GTP-binding protein